MILYGQNEEREGEAVRAVVAELRRTSQVPEVLGSECASTVRPEYAAWVRERVPPNPCFNRTRRERALEGHQFLVRITLAGRSTRRAG